MVSPWRSPSTAFVKVQPAETRTDYSVIAELPGKNEDNVVMAGAHLDSVIEGRGSKTTDPAPRHCWRRRC